MAEEITTKKVENLNENTEPADTDVFLIGASGSNTIKKIKFQNIYKKIMLLAHPIGSIYESTESTDPGDLFGGTWETFGAGRVLVGVSGSESEFNEVRKEGGSKEVTITTDQMPAHSHTVNSHNHSIPALSGSTNSTGAHIHTITADYNSDISLDGKYSRIAGNGTSSTSSPFHCGSAGNHSHTVTTKAGTSGNSAPGTNSQGGGQAHPNLQPYITVYRWIRTG